MECQAFNNGGKLVVIGGDDSPDSGWDDVGNVGWVDWNIAERANRLAVIFDKGGFAGVLDDFEFVFFCNPDNLIHVHSFSLYI